MNLQEALDYIHSFDDPYLRAINEHGKQTWGIQTVRALLSELGDPHLAYPTIHVAGTKGKGSTAAMMMYGMKESGLKAGLYTSPHLEDWRERIQINGRMIQPEQLIQLVSDIQLTAEEFPSLSAFEFSTALALFHFAREGCDAAVIEVGLGGRLDATSVIEPEVAVITNISIDHTQLLGETLSEIAAEKAAIIKNGVEVVSAPQPSEALQTITRTANRQQARLTVVGQDIAFSTRQQSWDGLDITVEGEHYQVGLAGSFQAENAAVAVTAMREAQLRDVAITLEGIRRGLQKVQWPGRLEVIRLNPRIILDSAHNPYSMQQSMQAIADLLRGEKVITLFGCMADKEINPMLATILNTSKQMVVTQVEHHRAATPAELKQRALNLGAEPQQLIEKPTIQSALDAILKLATPDDTIVITGSLAVAGVARTLLVNEA